MISFANLELLTLDLLAAHPSLGKSKPVLPLLHARLDIPGEFEDRFQVLAFGILSNGPDEREWVAGLADQVFCVKCRPIDSSQLIIIGWERKTHYKNADWSVRNIIVNVMT